MPFPTLGLSLSSKTFIQGYILHDICDIIYRLTSALQNLHDTYDSMHERDDQYHWILLRSEVLWHSCLCLWGSVQIRRLSLTKVKTLQTDPHRDIAANRRVTLETVINTVEMCFAYMHTWMHGLMLNVLYIVTIRSKTGYVHIIARKPALSGQLHAIDN